MPHTLYHFASKAGVEGIRTAGFIRPSFLTLPGGLPSAAAVVSLTANGDPADMIFKSLWDNSPLSGGRAATVSTGQPRIAPAPWPGNCGNAFDRGDP
jgi:hypothetical protein